MRRAIVAALLVAAVVGTGITRAKLVALDTAARTQKELLYMPNGKYLRVVSLGHAGLVADVVYLWAIQYYSDYEREDRYRYVEHIFGDVIGELDPAYIDPYWLGAVILTTEAHDVDGGLRLLDKGFERNPTAWILAYFAGWECKDAGRFDEAARYFDRAAKAPGAPHDLFRLKAGMTELTGNLREAIARWRDVLNDPTSDAGSRAIALRQIRALTVRADIQDLTGAVTAFTERNGRHPHTLDELVAARLVAALPRDPDGNPYVYDPATGKVSSLASRVLGS